MKKVNNLKEKLFTLGLMFLLAVIMYFLKITCLFKLVLRIPCPGCGITRAYLSLLRLDIGTAFAYNFMFWSVPILIYSYLVDGRLTRSKTVNLIIHGVLLLGFLVGWILKFNSTLI